MSNKNPGPKLFFSQFGGEQPIPPEFIAAMEREEEVQPVPNDVGPEELSDRIVESKVETNRDNERVRRTVKKKAGNIVLRTINTNDKGQPVQLVRTLHPTGEATPVPTSTETVADHDLGNGWSILEVGVEGFYDDEGNFVAGIFQGPRYSEEIPDPVPEEFKVLVPVQEFEETVEGDAIEPTLGTGDLARSESQVSTFLKRTVRRFRSVVGLPVSLTSYQTATDKQVETIVRTLKTVTTPTPPTATSDVETRNLGNGTMVETVATKPTASIDKVYTKEIPDAVPEEFRVLVPITTQELPVVGTAGTPTLGTGELERRESQITAFLKKVFVRARSLASLPVALDGLRWYEGLVATVTRTLATGNQSITGDYKTISAEVRATGAGTSVKEQAVVADYPDQPGQLYERELNVEIPYTDKTVVLGEGVGDAHTESTPVDYVRSKKRVFDITAIQEILADYMVVIDTIAHVDLPAVLQSVDALWSTPTGAGDDTETPGSVSFAGNYSFSVSSSRQAQGSMALVPELVHKILYPRGDHRPAKDYYFFLPDDGSVDVASKIAGLSPWPNFNPEEVSIVLKGERVALMAHASAHVSVSNSTSGGSSMSSTGGGKSTDKAPTIRSVVFPPTIHADITIGNTTPPTVALPAITARARLGAVDSGTFTATGSVAGEVTPDIIEATFGDVVVPTGDFLHEVDGSRFGYGFIAVRARVVTLS